MMNYQGERRNRDTFERVVFALKISENLKRVCHLFEGQSQQTMELLIQRVIPQNISLTFPHKHSHRMVKAATS